jgi:pimeloyl-ACP methyl ester carboxylesterase
MGEHRRMLEKLTFGSRATVATLVRKLEDAQGNKNGIADDETKPASQQTHGKNVFETNPLLYKLKATFEVGLSKRDEIKRIGDFLATSEQQLGPTSNIDKPKHVTTQDWNTFRADKAIACLRFDRKPSDITEGFVKASGSVDGHHIADRDVFTQRWKPVGPPSGKVIVLSPGFLESGRNYFEQADLLTRQGHEVVILDQQWAGFTTGKPGGIDRGFGIARDVAAVTAQAALWAKQAYGDKAEVIIAGTSMGGGAGAFGAALMNDAGKIQLNGPQMPKGVNLILQGPFFDRSDTASNKVLAGVGKVWGVRDIPTPPSGRPILSGDQATLRKLAMHATTDDLSGRGQAFHASTEDLATMKAMLEAGVRPQGKVYVLHARNDTLAKYDETVSWVKLMHDRAHLHTIESDSHVIEENEREQRLILDGLAWLAAP